MSDLHFQEIVPGVDAALGGYCNRGLINQGGSVLVVDSGTSVAEATPLHAAAQQRQKEGGLYLFDTHPHGDHVFGNQVFAENLIIAHQGVREDMVNHGEQTLARWRQNERMAALLSDVIVTPPTLTFQEKVTLFVGEIEVQLLYVSIAHSPSDSVAWLPQLGVLFAGDLLFTAAVPVLPSGGNSANWVSALEQLEQLGATYAIPGHGPIQTPQALTDLRIWFVTLRNQVGEALASGWDRETTITKVAPLMQKLVPRENGERLPSMIGEVFDELSKQAHPFVGAHPA